MEIRGAFIKLTKRRNYDNLATMWIYLSQLRVETGSRWASFRDFRIYRQEQRKTAKKQRAFRCYFVRRIFVRPAFPRNMGGRWLLFCRQNSKNSEGHEFDPWRSQRELYTS